MYTLEQAKAELLEICHLYPDRSGEVGSIGRCVYYFNREGQPITADICWGVEVLDPDDLAKPCCLIGELVERHRQEWLGLPDVFYGIRKNLQVKAALSHVPMIEDARKLLSDVQKEQDGGIQWGNLIKYIEGYEVEEDD